MLSLSMNQAAPMTPEMTPGKPIRKTTKDPKDPRPSRKAVTCKTCTPCRQKKTKCDGARPACNDCNSNGLTCVYPRDARRELRPSKARVQSLENTVALMLEHMRASGIEVPDLPVVEDDENGNPMEPGSPPEQPRHEAATPLLPTPSVSAASNMNSVAPNQTSGTPTSHPASNAGGNVQGQDFGVSGGDDEGEGDETMNDDNEVQAEDMSPGTALSHCEARVAGVYHEHGCVSSVHGLAGIMNPTSRERHKENISKIARKGQAAISESKARLISNAVLQKQREAQMFRQPRNMMDLDGCEPELAKHLLDLHFNRQHYAYLVTYRPAIMDSLASGGGPWANKLLLNAIYYSSALYSDRECLRSDPNDAQSRGHYFYQRFKQLLIDEIDKPTIPSAVALLLASASLTSQGHASAGWSLSGTAYRMIMDLGCHMMLGPDYQSTSRKKGSGMLSRDLEQEMRKRLYWGAYVTDATQSLYLGRPCMFASVEARVPLQLMDTFEELEDWQPYQDPQGPAFAQPAYSPHSANAVSTFTSLARLLQISTRITDLYGIESIKIDHEELLERKRSIEWELESWQNSLLAHQRFDPEASFIPPPHQITPHTTFHALTILLNRAFLEEGHLRRHSSAAAKKSGEEACVRSALEIQRYTQAYRTAFTLRRAPYLLSYAVYSAVTVILRQERHERGRFTDTISFYWTCLHELQRGCNFGLKKPLAILQDMFHELQVSVNEGAAIDLEQNLEPSFDESLFSTLSIPQDTYDLTPQTSIGTGSDYLTQGSWDAIGEFGSTYEAITDDMLGFLNDQEKGISQDTLYGLFAPSQKFS